MARFGLRHRFWGSKGVGQEYYMDQIKECKHLRNIDAGLLTLEERNKSFEQIRVKLGLKMKNMKRSKPRIEEYAYFLRFRARLRQDWIMDDGYYSAEQERFFAPYEKQMRGKE